MKKSQEVLLKLLSNELFHGDFVIDELSYDEWNQVFIEAESQTVTRIAYIASKKMGLPECIDHIWLDKADDYMGKSMFVNYDHILLHKWLKESQIPYVILKGCSSAYYYPIPLDRAMGDVDFFVKSSDCERTGKVLKQHGLKKIEIDHLCHEVYVNASHHYEMHFSLAGMPNGKCGEIVRQYIEDIFETAFLYTSDLGDMLLPSKFHHGLVILLHTIHHLTGEGIGLRHLCDWGVFLQSCTNDEFQELFQRKLEAIGMWKFASALSLVCITYLGCSEKKCILDIDRTIIDSLMEDILSGGNFGGKDNANRQFESMMISDRAKSGITNKSMFYYFIKSINDAIKSELPFTRKYAFMIPVGWFYLGGRRIIRVIKGQRKLPNFDKMISDASKRRKLYSKLGIFETEK